METELMTSLDRQSKSVMPGMEDHAAGAAVE
jgi:hypothetical protein